MLLPGITDRIETLPTWFSGAGWRFVENGRIGEGEVAEILAVERMQAVSRNHRWYHEMLVRHLIAT